MAKRVVRRRIAYHLGGYNLVTPEAAHQRFSRELRKYEATWSVAASVSDPIVGEDLVSWHVTTSGSNWTVETEYRLLRWDDLMAAAQRRSMWRRIPLGLLAFADFVAAGALWRYLRFNWRYAGFFLYPFVLFALFAVLAWGMDVLVTGTTGSTLVGICAGLVAFALLLGWPARRFFLPLLFDDWIFSRDYIRGREAGLEARLERVAHDLVARADEGRADEVLVIGHSLGAVLAVDLLDRAMRVDPDLGKEGPSIALVSVGSSLLKIGLHAGAKRFRAAVGRVAQAAHVFWVEYQALTDVMNFYKTNPVAAMGLDVPGRPMVRIERIRKMVQPARYRRIRRNFFKVHCQFVNGNDRRAAYDYFMLVCGPLPAECHVRYADGAVSAIGADGAFLGGEPLALDSLMEESR
jgi:hypothetical protein